MIPAALRTRLALLVAGVVLPFLALLGFQARNEASREGRRIEQSTLAHSRVVAARVDDHVSNVESLLLVLSNTLSLVPADIEKNESVLVEVKSRLPDYYNNLKIKTATGEPLGSSSGRKTTSSDRKYAQAALASKGLGFGEPVISRSTGEWTIAIASAVLDRKGEVTAVVSASTRLNRFEALLDPTRSLPAGSTITVVDETGLVLSRLPEPDAWIGRPSGHAWIGLSKEGARTIRDASGLRSEALASCSKAPWRVVVSFPESALPGQSRVWRSAGLVAVAVCAAFALAGLFAGGITRPIREGEARFRSLHRNVADAIYWIEPRADGALVVRDPNPAFEELVKRRASEIAGHRHEDLFPAEAARVLTAHCRRCLEERRIVQVEERLPLLSGERRFAVQLVPVPEPDSRVSRIAVFLKDVTETRNREAAFLHAQKLESLGVLAGGVAHDFNNLLTAMGGNLTLARMDLSPDSPAQPPLVALERLVERSADLTRQMLAYSGKGLAVPQPTDLNRLVEEMVGLLTVSMSKKVEVRFDLQPDVLPVLVDRTQFRQLVMNLVTNASEAIRDVPGVIRVSTRPETISATAAKSDYSGATIAPGRYSVLEVNDTGMGMSPATRDRIFDPFFTTKSGGSGLGLSAALGILKAHSAHIDVETTVRQGTTFRVYVPEYVEDRLPADPTDEAQPPLSARTILVVDDEAEVRTATARLLESMGCRVLVAADGVEAVSMYRQYPGAIDAVLMDFSMPGHDGREAAARIRAFDPDAHIILTSGFAANIGEEVSDFLPKPYNATQLRKALRRRIHPA